MKGQDVILALVGGVVIGAVAVYAYTELTKPVLARARARAGLYNVGGARWGPYMRPVTAGRVPTSPGLGLRVGARRAITVGPYAGGLVAPKFIPGVLVPKFTHGA